MKTVYIVQDGAILRREGRRLHVHARGGVHQEVQTHDLEQLVIMGNVTLTSGAVDLLVSSQIDAVLLSHRGRFRARISAAGTGNVRLRLVQYAMVQSSEKALDLARMIVSGKLSNQRVHLLRHARRHGGSEEVERACVAIAAARRRAGLARDIDEARGCEGSGSAAYFRVFGKILRSSDFTFEGRNRRPPLDPVNVLLSFGYTLLFNAAEAAVGVVGLDPYLGALHAPLVNRPSLVCDLMEEFRAPIVDSLVVAAINRGSFGADDFEDTAEGEPVSFKEEAARRFVTLFERRLRMKVKYGGLETTYRDVVLAQARLLARHFLGDKLYQPFRMT